MARQRRRRGEPPTGEQLAPPPCPKLTAFTVSHLVTTAFFTHRREKRKHTQLTARRGLFEEPQWLSGWSTQFVGSARDVDVLNGVGWGAGSPHGAGVVRAAVPSCVRGAFVMQRCVTCSPTAAASL